MKTVKGGGVDPIDSDIPFLGTEADEDTPSLVMYLHQSLLEQPEPLC